MTGQDLDRRRWLARTTVSLGGLAALPVHTSLAIPQSKSPNERLKIGSIGVGNRGANNTTAVKSEEIVALCDVDRRFLERASARYPVAKTYRDYREMFEHTDLDAVVISTPDHSHFHPAMLALMRGLHVYCEKPLAHNVREVARLAAAAPDGVVTQMGNQHHSSNGYRRAVALIRAGAIGDVTEVHSWTNRPLWPQGVQRPAAASPPDALDWNLWLGPAPERPYAEGYHPFAWRGFWDFGSGALGDMGPHLLDPAFTALELSHPLEITARSTPVNDETAPASSIVRMQFAARDKLPPVSLTWYDGDHKPPRAVTGTDRPPGNGTMLIGSQGKLFCPQLGAAPIVLANAGSSKPSLPKVDLPPAEDHHAQWIRCCKQGQAAGSNFEFAAKLTTACLLGNIAIRTGTPLSWDPTRLRFRDDRQADALLERVPRSGWQ